MGREGWVNCCDCKFLEPDSLYCQQMLRSVNLGCPYGQEKGGRIVKLKEEHFDHLKDGNILICKIGDEVSPMWGMSCVLLSEEQIKALLNGDCIWFTDEEYATVLRAEPVDYRHIVYGKWKPRMIGNLQVSWACSNCYKIHFDGATPFCPHCGAKMTSSE